MENSALALPAGYRLGIVEGFFGREWSWSDRQLWAGFLSELGFNSYLYAPKADNFLRKHWQQPLPQDHSANLQSLAAACTEHAIDFGIGLSPYELYRNFDQASRQILKDKLATLNQLNPDTLCILFDDMPGGLPELAAVQCEIMDFILNHSTARQFQFCPTYYSDDPLLARYFGAEPQGYLEELGQTLPADIQILWTGPKVISTDYPEAHLKRVAEKLQRKPLIWDNYPVNDSKQLCQFLQIAPAPRDTDTLKKCTSGHLVNPMNQAWLSRIPVYALALQYAGSQNNEANFVKALNSLCGPRLSQQIQADRHLLAETGLDALNDSTKQKLLNTYADLLAHPATSEITDWLEGRYEFDPACLT